MEWFENLELSRLDALLLHWMGNGDTAGPAYKSEMRLVLSLKLLHNMRRKYGAKIQKAVQRLIRLPAIEVTVRIGLEPTKKILRCKKYWAVKKRPSLKFVASLLAIVAVAAEQNFGDFAELLAEAKAASG